MRIPAVVFEPERAHCPSCFFPYERPPARCERCGCALDTVQARFPFQAPAFEPLMDPEDRLSPKEQAKVRRLIARFQTKFPQLRFVVHVTRLPEGADAREFGFWLFNHGPLEPEESPEDRTRTLLLLIDRQNRQVSLTTGYQIDPFLGDDSGTRFLGESKETFISGDFVGGVEIFLKRIRDHFSKLSEPANYVAERYRRSPKPDLTSQ